MITYTVHNTNTERVAFFKDATRPFVIVRRETHRDRPRVSVGVVARYTTREAAERRMASLTRLARMIGHSN